MADNEYAGSAMYLAWIHPGGTTTLQTEFRNFSWQPTLNFIDATAGADIGLTCDSCCIRFGNNAAQAASGSGLRPCEQNTFPVA